MDIIDPVVLGDVACTRASPKYAWDRTGTLVQVPANTLAVTYDPSDLNKAPYALIEPAATNLALNTDNLFGDAWGDNGGTFSNGGYPSPRGDISASLWTIGTNRFDEGKYQRFTDLMPGSWYVASFFCQYLSGSAIMMIGPEGLGYTFFDPSLDTPSLITSGLIGGMLGCGDGWSRVFCAFQATSAAHTIVIYQNQGGQVSVSTFGFMLEPGTLPSSYVASGGVRGGRAADVIAAGAGLVYSNVPIVEATYDSSATYAKGAVVYDPSTYNTFSSVVDANKGKALTDPLSWAPGGATNRRAMFDQYNNTQTTAAEEIIAVVSPKAVSQGFYIGNVEGTEVRISVVDLYRGLVYQEVQNLKISTSGSSFFNWGFKRLRRKTWAVGLKLPPFANALITITVKRPGGTAKCGMCVVGPTMDLGRTLMTLGAEIKDFSDTSFNFDGTSTTTTRNWAKRITADVMVDASRVDDVYEMMATLRQRPIVWVGSVKRGVAIAFGRYSTMKPVVKGDTRWDMSLQIEGTV